ncbi:hypothetical protein BGZ98_002170 [Dissophora globulifera]|nr:hypothetical protein BGZ98_002170 [Dissophora globulifera]
MDRALDLPEILAVVSHFLPRADLLTCLRVCKAWKSQLEPRLWRRFRYNDLDARPPSEALINQNAKHVRVLSVEADSSNFPTAFFDEGANLRDFTLYKRRSDHHHEDLQWSDVLTRMISNNPQLQRIAFRIDRSNSLGNLVPTPELMRCLGACSNLEFLETSEMYHGKASNAVTELYMRASANGVKHLCTIRELFSATFTFPNDLIFKNVQVLEMKDIMGMTNDTQLTWISRCPNLTSFRWSTGMDIPVERFKNIIPSACPHLVELHFAAALSDSEIAQILEPFQRIEKLSMVGTLFGKVALQALKPHFSTLLDINLQSSTSATGALVHEILCSCPNLQTIRADKMSDLNMPKQEKWICNKLRHFDVGLYVTAHADRAVYKRLAQLTELEYLSVRSPNSVAQIRDEDDEDEDDEDEDDPGVPISVSLDAGLGELKTLKRLQEFSCKKLLNITFRTSGAFKVVQWMVKNWPSLERLEAVLGSEFNNRRREEIAMDKIFVLLEKSGIKYQHYEEDEDEDEDDDRSSFEEYGYDSDWRDSEREHRIAYYELPAAGSSAHEYETYDPDCGGMPEFDGFRDSDEANYWDPDLY